MRASQQPMISGYGTGSGFELYVQDQGGVSTDELLRVTNDFVDSLNRRPEISRAYTTFDTRYPQYMVEVDAANCLRHNVDPADVLSTLAGYVGGTYSSNLNRFTKLYRVMVQSDAGARLSTDDLKNMFVRTLDGKMSSIDNYIKLTKVYGSESLSRFNLFPSIAVYGQQGDGYSSGEAVEAIRQTAKACLPAGFGYEFGGMSREEAGQGNTTVLVFGICVAFIYLILCALYESLTVPLAVLAARAFRRGRMFHICATVGPREQYLYADWPDNAHRPVGKDGHFAYRVCLGPAQRGHGVDSLGHFCGKGKVQADSNDVGHYGVWHAAADVCHRSRGQGQYFGRSLYSRRTVVWHYRAVVCGTGAVCTLAVLTRAYDALAQKTGLVITFN